jgi:hypothetical protein
MDNFCQLWNRLDGEEPEDENQKPDNGYGLKPLNPEDMAITSMDDVAAELERKKKLGWNPTKLGDPMSDEEFQKFHGL